MRTGTLDYIIENLQNSINKLIEKDYGKIKYDINMLNQRLIYLKRRYNSAPDLEIGEEFDDQEMCFKLQESSSNIIDYTKELNCISKDLGVLWIKYVVGTDLNKEVENAK